MPEKKTRLALVLPSLHAGGMEKVMAELGNYFSIKPDFEVHLILFGNSPKIFFPINSGIKIHKQDRLLKSRPKVLEGLKTLRFIRKEIKSIRPVSVLSFGTQWNNLVLLALLNTSIPVFVSDRGSPARKYKFSTELFRSALYPKASGIIAQTEKAKNILRNRFPSSKIKTIGNPIPSSTESGNTEKINTILTVGRLIESKHHDRLIKIFSRLKAPEWKLIIVGGEALKEKNFEKLKKLIRDLNLEERVVLTGEQKNTDQYYKESSIFAFNSSIEGFPNVVGEALSAGLPVVSYDCVAGPSEMITNGENGFLVPVFNDEQFREKLQLLIDNENLRKKMAEKARESISKFSIETIGKQYLDFILPGS